MRSKIKVVHLITRLDFGGAQQNTLYTVSHLDASRFEVELISGPGGLLDEDARSLSSDRGGQFRLRFLGALVREVNPSVDMIALLQLRQLLKTAAPDIVHTHSSKAGILGRLAARMAGVPHVIHTYHGFGFHERQSAGARSLYVALEKLCARLSERSVFVSEANRRDALRLGIAREGDPVIRSGVKLGDYPARIGDKAAKKASLGCRMHKPLIVSVGNLKPQKNPEAFVRLAERCLKDVPEANWLFIGDGPMRARIQGMLVAKNLSNRVFFPGWRRDTAEILAAADLFVMTSLWEGLPRALVEAMKTGLACVCYATDGVKDVLIDRETGLAVAPGGEETMAARVIELLRNPGMAQLLGRNAARAIGPEFDIDEMVRRQEKLYSSLIDGRKPL